MLLTQPTRPIQAKKTLRDRAQQPLYEARPRQKNGLICRKKTMQSTMLICMRDFWDKECNRQLSIVLDTSLFFPQIPSEWAQRGMSPSGMPNSSISP